MASSLPFLSQFFSSFDALIYFSVAFFSSQCCRNSARWTARTDFLLSIFSPGLQSVGLVEARSYSAVDRCSDAHSASLWLVRQLTDSFQMTVGSGCHLFMVMFMFCSSAEASVHITEQIPNFLSISFTCLNNAYSKYH